MSLLARRHNVSDIPYENQYFTTEMTSAGTVVMAITGAVTTSYVTSVSYSLDNGATWTTTANSSSTVTITVPSQAVGKKILWKGEAVAYALSGNATKFTSASGAGNYKVYGNVMSLFYGDDFIGRTTWPTTTTYHLAQLFNGNTKIVDAENLILPATKLYQYDYYYMFYNCTNLVTPPQIMATNLSGGTYTCREMFRGCTKLTESPILRAPTSYNQCYYRMFYGCSVLSKITCYTAYNSSNNRFYQWVSNIPASGTFYYKKSIYNWANASTGVSARPSRWTLVDLDAT